MNPLHDEIALKECPFCGAEAGFAEGADNDGPWVAVACTECGCGGGKHYPIMDDAHPNAASEWNRRTRLPEIAALREGEWQPIETAPKDGPDLLLHSPCWPTLIVGHPATHWQPLPAPPSPANSEVRS